MLTNETPEQMNENAKAFFRFLAFWLWRPIPGFLFIAAAICWSWAPWLVWALLLLWVCAGVYGIVSEPARFARALEDFSTWSQTLRARIVAAIDVLPGYWATAPVNNDHAHYRREYERIVQMSARDDDAYLVLAAVLKALKGYGDDPLAKPEVSRPRALISIPSMPGLSTFRLWALIVLIAWAALASSAATFLSWRLGNVVEERDAARADLSLRTQERDAERNMRAVEHQQAARQAQESADLIAENEARSRRLSRRLERSNADAMDAARRGAAPDLDTRLRELGSPASAGDGPPNSSTGGMHGAASGSAGVSAAGDTAGHSGQPADNAQPSAPR